MKGTGTGDTSLGGSYTSNVDVREFVNEIIFRALAGVSMQTSDEESKGNIGCLVVEKEFSSSERHDHNLNKVLPERCKYQKIMECNKSPQKAEALSGLCDAVVASPLVKDTAEVLDICVAKVCIDSEAHTLTDSENVSDKAHNKSNCSEIESEVLKETLAAEEDVACGQQNELAKDNVPNEIDKQEQESSDGLPEMCRAFVSDIINAVIKKFEEKTADHDVCIISTRECERLNSCEDTTGIVVPVSKFKCLPDSCPSSPEKFISNVEKIACKTTMAFEESCDRVKKESNMHKRDQSSYETRCSELHEAMTDDIVAKANDISEDKIENTVSGSHSADHCTGEEADLNLNNTNDRSSPEENNANVGDVEGKGEPTREILVPSQDIEMEPTYEQGDLVEQPTIDLQKEGQMLSTENTMVNAPAESSSQDDDIVPCAQILNPDSFHSTQEEESENMAGFWTPPTEKTSNTTIETTNQQTPVKVKSLCVHFASPLVECKEYIVSSQDSQSTAELNSQEIEHLQNDVEVTCDRPVIPVKPCRLFRAQSFVEDTRDLLDKYEEISVVEGQKCINGKVEYEGSALENSLSENLTGSERKHEGDALDQGEEVENTKHDTEQTSEQTCESSTTEQEVENTPQSSFPVSTIEIAGATQESVSVSQDYFQGQMIQPRCTLTAQDVAEMKLEEVSTTSVLTTTDPQPQIPICLQPSQSQENAPGKKEETSGYLQCLVMPSDRFSMLEMLTPTCSGLEDSKVDEPVETVDLGRSQEEFIEFVPASQLLSSPDSQGSEVIPVLKNQGNGGSKNESYPEQLPVNNVDCEESKECVQDVDNSLEVDIAAQSTRLELNTEQQLPVNDVEDMERKCEESEKSVQAEVDITHSVDITAQSTRLEVNTEQQLPVNDVECMKRKCEENIECVQAEVDIAAQSTSLELSTERCTEVSAICVLEQNSETESEVSEGISALRSCDTGQCIAVSCSAPEVDIEEISAVHDNSPKLTTAAPKVCTENVPEISSDERKSEPCTGVNCLDNKNAVKLTVHDESDPKLVLSPAVRAVKADSELDCRANLDAERDDMLKHTTEVESKDESDVKDLDCGANLDAERDHVLKSNTEVEYEDESDIKKLDRKPNVGAERDHVSRSNTEEVELDHGSNVMSIESEVSSKSPCIPKLDCDAITESNKLTVSYEEESKKPHEFKSSKSEEQLKSDDSRQLESSKTELTPASEMKTKERESKIDSHSELVIHVDSVDTTLLQEIALTCDNDCTAMICKEECEHPSICKDDQNRSQAVLNKDSCIELNASKDDDCKELPVPKAVQPQRSWGLDILEENSDDEDELDFFTTQPFSVAFKGSQSSSDFGFNMLSTQPFQTDFTQLAQIRKLPEMVTKPKRTHAEEEKEESDACNKSPPRKVAKVGGSMGLKRRHLEVKGLPDKDQQVPGVSTPKKLSRIEEEEEAAMSEARVPSPIFKWQYVPSVEDDDLQMPPPFDEVAESSVYLPSPLKTPNKARRVGLSRRHRGPSLHQLHSKDPAQH